MSAQDSSAGAATCPRCGDRFGCGALAGREGGEAACWCFAEAPVAPDPALGGRCLCPRCLREAAAAGVESEVSSGGGAARGRSPGSRRT